MTPSHENGYPVAHTTPIADRIDAPKDLEVPTPISTTEGMLTWRALELGDAPSLLALFNEVEHDDHTPRRTTASDVADLLASDAKRTTNTICAVDGFGRVRAYGAVSSASGDTTIVRAHVAGAVSTSVRGQGLGTLALAWIVARAKQLLVEIGKPVPARIVAFVSDDAHDERALLAEHGFAEMRRYSYERRDLSDPIGQVTLDEGLRLVPWSPDLDDAIRLAHNDAFADHWGSQPRSPESWAEGRAHFAPTWSFAVLDIAGKASSGADTSAGAAGARVAGYITSSRNPENWEATGVKSGFSEVLGVRREYRGRKISKALLVAVMEAYRADGMDFADLDVDMENPSGAHHFYHRLGYVPFEPYTMFSIEI